MVFVRENLQGDHYTWNEDVNLSTFQGQPSRRLFNRYDGYQVLFLINSFGSQSGNFDPEQGQKMESLIMHDLPLDARSEISVLNWLKAATSTAL